MLEPQNERPRFLVGTASWTDPTLVKSDSFYPLSMKTAEDRLKFYAAQFNTVEVDSSYYVLIAEKTAQLWADRTPPEFIFNVKAFSLLTQHAAEVSRLPLQIKELLTENESSQRQLKRPSPAVLELAFQMFWSSLTPLRNAQKLGMLLFQFPPYFIFSTRNIDYLAKLPALMPEARIATTTSPGPGVGSGNSRSATFFSPRKTRPRIFRTQPTLRPHSRSRKPDAWRSAAKRVSMMSSARPRAMVVPWPRAYSMLS